MKASDPNTTVRLPGLESPIALGMDNGHVLAGEPAARQDPRVRDPRGQTVERLRLLWENRRLLGRVSGVGLLLSTLMAFLIPNQYQSSTRLMPPDNQSNSGVAMAVAALSGGVAGGLGMAGDLLGLRSTSDLLAGVLGSRTVEDKLIERFNLEKVYGTRWRETARRNLAAWTDVSVDRKSQIITIRVTDTSPERAAAVAQAYVEELNRTLADVSTSSARRERIFLQARLQAVNHDLEAAEKEFSQFASRSKAIDIKEQGRALVDAAAILQGQLIAARSELEGLRQIYADSNVRVRAMQARIAELEVQLRKVGGQGEGASPQDANQNDSLYPSIRQLPLLGVPYADLYRKAKVQEAIFETLTKEYELARVQEAKEIPTVKVLDPANLPEKKSFPPHLLLMLLGTTLTFSCGVTWVFARTLWEQTKSTDPGKVLAKEVFDTVKAAMPWASRNGHAHSSEAGAAGGATKPNLEKEAGK